MIRITIDRQEFEVKEGTTVIDAARAAGRDIPSMCYREGKEHITSCMVCLVKDCNTGRLFPSCSVKVTEGMELITIDEEIHEARKTALELLLSEHVGDCEAPCQITCPAHMNIPLMNRLLAKGNFEEAMKVVKMDIALPSVFGWICPAPCEGACHRKTLDEAVSICLLKRYAGDHNLLKAEAWIPETEAEKGRKIAIIGSGPAGLAAAWYLQLRGYDCEVFDRHEKAGGSLHREVEAGKLPLAVLEKEIAIIAKAGVIFHLNTMVDSAGFHSLKSSYAAIIVATGQGTHKVQDWGLEVNEKGIVAGNETYQAGNSAIFVCGSALRPAKLAIRCLGQGKEAAFSVSQYLEGREVKGESFMFNSRFGKLLKEEALEYLKESIEGIRIQPKDALKGFTEEEVKEEASRCLHCDCRAIDHCSLRILSDRYRAEQKRFKSDERAIIRKHFQHELVVYEPSKCIRCGICVEICIENNEGSGFTFIGRGFDIEIGIPFNEKIGEALKKTAHEVVEKCPTGALSHKRQG